MSEIPPYIEETIKVLQPLIKKPKLTDKYLAKPPFRFLLDIVTNLISSTGFGGGLYTPDELNAEAYESKESKLAFLTKLTDYVASQSGQTVAAKAQKIVAGLEPENTNKLLQLMALQASKPAAKTEEPKKKRSSSKSRAGDGEAKPAKSAAKEEPSPKTAKKKSSKTEGKSEGGEKKKAASSEDGDKKKKKSSSTKSDGAKKSTNKKAKTADGDTKKKTKKAADSTSTVKPAGEVERQEPTVEEEELARPAIPTPMDEDLEQRIIKSTARPQTARPPPPRIQSNVRTVEKVEVETTAPKVASVIQDGNEEEEETTTGLEDDEERPEASAVPEAAIDSEQQHGGLMRDILAASKALEGVRGTEQTKERPKPAEALTTKHNKEVLQKEVTRLQEMMDYVQEDFENMSKELEKWRTESSTQQAKVEEEKRLTEQTFAPLNDRLSELDQSIKDILLKINAAKANVEKNDEHISKLLRMVVHHE